MDVLFTHACAHKEAKNGVSDGWKLSCECWDSNPDSLEEQAAHGLKFLKS